MERTDRRDEQVRDAYRLPIEGQEQARDRAIARLRREPPPSRSRWALGWWLDPDGLHARPLVAAAGLIVVLGVGALAGAFFAVSRSPGPGTPEPVVAVPAGGPTLVTFVFRAPGASRVSLVGDFNGWDLEATPLQRAALGDAWTARVPLADGLHAYAFVIDGRDWAPDPSAPLAPEPTFGRRNSVVVVGEEGVL